MYSEIEMIKAVDCKNARIELLLLFLEEYSGWLQHLKVVGLAWGANGEEIGANQEAIKCREHIEKIKKEICLLLNR